MSDTALRRTVRRCTAVLAILLSLYPMLFVARLDDDGVTYSHPVLEFADELALAVSLGAVLYLGGSLVVEIAGTER